MQRPTAFVIAAIFAISLIGSTDPAAAVNEPSRPNVITGGDAETRAIVEDAVASFTGLGLELPRIAINIHPRDKQFCDGHRAYWQSGRDHDVIDLCFIDTFTVLHELAHSWEQHNLTDETRIAFLELTPGQKWRSDEVKYNSQGIEDAANTIAGVVLSRQIGSTTSPRLADIQAFDVLVGGSV